MMYVYYFIWYICDYVCVISYGIYVIMYVYYLIWYICAYVCIILYGIYVVIYVYYFTRYICDCVYVCGIVSGVDMYMCERVYVNI